MGLSLRVAQLSHGDKTDRTCSRWRDPRAGCAGICENPGPRARRRVLLSERPPYGGSSLRPECWKEKAVARSRSWVSAASHQLLSCQIGQLRMQVCKRISWPVSHRAMSEQRFALDAGIQVFDPEQPLNGSDALKNLRKSQCAMRAQPYLSAISLLGQPSQLARRKS